MPELLPNRIPPEVIVEAVRGFDAGARHRFGLSTFYDLFFEGRRYPPKAIVGLAAAAVTGRESGPGDFSGGLDSKCSLATRYISLPAKLSFEN